MYSYRLFPTISVTFMLFQLYLFLRFAHALTQRKYESKPVLTFLHRNRTFKRQITIDHDSVNYKMYFEQMYTEIFKIADFLQSSSKACVKIFWQVVCCRLEREIERERKRGMREDGPVRRKCQSVVTIVSSMFSLRLSQQVTNTETEHTVRQIPIFRSETDCDNYSLLILVVRDLLSTEIVLKNINATNLFKNEKKMKNDKEH